MLRRDPLLANCLRPNDLFGPQLLHLVVVLVFDSALELTHLFEEMSSYWIESCLVVRIEVFDGFGVCVLMALRLLTIGICL